MIQTTQQTANNRGGNGRFKPLKRTNKQQTSAQEFDYLTLTDSRMRFNNSQDPIYFLFEHMERKSVSTLAKEFVKDTFFEIANFISKAV